LFWWFLHFIFSGIGNFLYNFTYGWQYQKR
jgi:hypothetical protein